MSEWEISKTAIEAYDAFLVPSFVPPDMVNGVTSPRLIADLGLLAVSRFVNLVERIAFWTAVVLPLCYLPGFVLVSNGRLSQWVLVLLLGVNLVAVAGGYRYDPAGGRRGQEA